MNTEIFVNAHSQSYIHYVYLPNIYMTLNWILGRDSSSRNQGCMKYLFVAITPWPTLIRNERGVLSMIVHCI